MLDASPAAAAATNNRRSLFDPFFADEDFADVRPNAASEQTSTTASNKNIKIEPGRQQTRPAAISAAPPSTTRKPPMKPRSIVSSRIASARSEPAKRSTVAQSDYDITSLISTPSASQSVATSKRAAQPTEAPHHWSALEDYYKRLGEQNRQRFAPSQDTQNAQQINQDPGYIIVGNDDTLNNYLRRLPKQQPYGKSQAPFGLLLPDDRNARVASTYPDASTYGSTTKSVAFAVPSIGTTQYDDSGFARTPGSYHDSSPGISRTRPAPLDPVQFTGLKSPPIWPAYEQTPSVDGTKRVPIASVADKTPIYSDSPWAVIRPINPPTTKTAVLRDEDMTPEQWRELAKMLVLQQQQRQQQRLVHQHKTFSDLGWYNPERITAIQQEESFCDYNYVPLMQNAREAAQGIGEYPSHMGVYNESIKDENFLCAATLVHSNYALTLASCVHNMKPDALVVRAGEWAAYKNDSIVSKEDKQSRTRSVRRIELFPKYTANSVDHNLALLELSRPIDTVDIRSPYIWPACQTPARATMRASSCWSPVRNTTLVEYFDADGEGETKLRKQVRMIEVPVKLHANDENECLRATGISYFTYQHPNYICAADYRRHEWRIKLNQSDHFGSGIYCNEDNRLNLVSIVHPVKTNTSSASGYLDLSYYRPWMRNVIAGIPY